MTQSDTKRVSTLEDELRWACADALRHVGALLSDHYGVHTMDNYDRFCHLVELSKVLSDALDKCR